MPSVSRKQQRFFGIVRAYQKGDLKTPPSPEVQGAATSMKKKDVKKFASTKHKGLPEKKVRKESFNEDYVKELEDGLVKMDYPTYMEVDELMKKIAKENDIDTTTLHMAFKTKHLMVPDDWAKRKMMEPVIIPKTPHIEEKKASKAMDAGARAKRLLLRKEYRAKVSEIIPDELMDSFQINPDAHNKAKRQAKIRNMTKSSNPNEKKVAERKVDDKTKLPKLNTEEQDPEGMKLRDVEKMNRQKKLLAAAKKAPEVKNKIVSANKLREGNLHNWFKGSKSKDGKGGWVNVVTGGTCASDEPGEGTPKCVSSSKRASMTKAERASASRRKKKADPNQQSKSGAAKPTYVSTDKKKKSVKEGFLKEVSDAKMFRQSDENLDKLKKKFDGMDDGPANSFMRKRISKELKRREGQKRKEMLNPTVQIKDEYIAEKKVKRDEYGDIVGGPKISKKQLKKNLSSNEKDQFSNNESYDAKKKAMKDAVLSRKEDLKKKEKMTEMASYTGPNKKDRKQIKKLDKKDYAEKLAKYEKNMDPKKRQELKNKATKGMKFTYEETIKMTKKAYNKLHRDFKSDDPNNPRTTKYVKGKGTVSMPVKFIEAKENIDEAAAWTRKAGKNQSGGLNEKGRKSYERANPGSDLKAPSKKKGNKRRASFCARMKGMKSKLTSAKTARDPDSRINKSLRAWNCSYEPENGEVLSETMLATLKRKVGILGGKSNKKPAKKTTGRDAGAIARKVLQQKQHKKYVNFLDIDEEKKKCGEGEYYCNDDKKCKSIPKGYRVGYGGMLKPDNSDDDTNGKNGNGNGHGGNGNGGNGGGNGGGDGGGE